MGKRVVKFSSVILVLAMLAVTPAMAQQGKKIKVGVAMALINPFVTYLIQGMQNYEKTHPEFDVTVVDAKSDANTQLGQVESFIAEGYDAIVVLVVDAKMSGPIVADCKQAKIPLIALNRKFDNPDCFIGTDAIAGGVKLGQEMVRRTNGQGNAAIIHGVMGQESEVMRTKGIMQVLAQNPGIKVVLEGAADWDRAKGLNLVENWIQSGTKFNIIFAESDEMAIGAFKAVSAVNMRKNYIIGSCDGGQAGVQAVSTGDIDFTCFQDPYQQGALSLQAAAKLSAGQSVDKQILVEWQLVTKENADKYVKMYAGNQ
jgi:inositol transport system substrate-binding protein